MLTALSNPTVKARLIEFGSEPVGSSPEEFRAYINQELKKWGDLVKVSGATVE